MASLLCCGAEKKQFEESSHYIPSDCLCEGPATRPGRERGLFVSEGNQLEASREQTRDKTSVNSKSVESLNDRGFGVSLVGGPSALESFGEW